MSVEGDSMTEIREMLQQRHGTRMTLIGWIYTDIFNPCVSASSVQSVFYRNTAIINDDKKPQMNADERRYFPASESSKTIYRKGRKERKATHQESLCPLCSLWLDTSSTPAHERAPPQPAVHPRLSRVGG
jgi:hypothetical protein